MDNQPPLAPQPRPTGSAHPNDRSISGPIHEPATAPTPAPAPAPTGESRRPGAVRAVAVLGFVQAGFNAMGAVMGLSGAGQLAEFGLRRTSVGSSLTILGLFGLASAGLLIIGGLTVLKGKALIITVGATGSILLSIWWAIEFDFIRQLQTTALMMAVLPIVALGLLFGTPARSWVRFELPSVPTAGNSATPPPAGMSTAAHSAPMSAPAGWQADPTGRHQVRYWDGAVWTVHVADNGITGTDPL